MILPIRSLRFSACLLVSVIATLVTARAELIHRFSFSDGAARDSVGKVEARLQGPAASIADGKLVLNNPETAFGAGISHLEFTAPIIPAGATTATFVVWFTARDAGPFARVLNIGASEAGEGTHFIYLTPRTAEGMGRVAITGTDVFERIFLDVPALDDGSPHMVAIVIDGAAGQLRLYVDGKMAAQPLELGTHTLDKIKTTESWLGKSSFSADPGLTATFDEFRVYSHALTAEEIAAAHAAGPDRLP